MKPTVPILCGAALAAMCTAVVGHWWSVRQFVAAIDAGVPVAREVRATAPAPKPPEPLPAPLAKLQAAVPLAAMDPAQKEFFETLTRTVKDLQNQNRNLMDQLGETNREIYNMQFRLDTVSDKFRPMPVNDDRPDTTLDDDGGSGVLPPRPEPNFQPAHD